MSEYGVGVLANRFALVDLEDDEDPFEVLKRRQEEKATKKKIDPSEKEKKSKETVGLINGSNVAKKKPLVQKENKNKEDMKNKQERKNVANETPNERPPRRSYQEDSEPLEDGFEQQRNGSFRSNRREGFQKTDGRPAMKDGKGFGGRSGEGFGGRTGEGFGGRSGEGFGGRSGEGYGGRSGEGYGGRSGEGYGGRSGEGYGGRSGEGYGGRSGEGYGGRSGGGRGFQGGRGGGGGGRSDDDWNKSDATSPDENENKRRTFRQPNQQRDDDGFSRQDRRTRFPTNGNDSRTGNRPSGGRWRGGGGNRSGFEGRNNGFQENNMTGRSGNASEGEEKANVPDDWNTSGADDGNKTFVDKNNEKNDSGIQENDDENSPDEKTSEQANQELTLDEWKALKKRDGPTYNLRKAGEGEDLSKWKDMVKLDKKKPGVDNEEESEGEYEVCEYPQRVGRQKYIKDLDFKFADRRKNAGPGGRPRNNRPGGRPFTPRTETQDTYIQGHSNKQPSSVPVPKVDDERAFPSLG